MGVTMFNTTANPQANVCVPEHNAFAHYTCEGAFLKVTAVEKWLKEPERGWKMVLKLKFLKVKFFVKFEMDKFVPNWGLNQ